MLAGAVGLLSHSNGASVHHVRPGRVFGRGRGGFSSFDPAPFHLLSLSFTTMHIIKCNNLCKQRLKFLPRWRAGERERERAREMALDAKREGATYPQGEAEGWGWGWGS